MNYSNIITMAIIVAACSQHTVRSMDYDKYLEEYQRQLQEDLAQQTTQLNAHMEEMKRQVQEQLQQYSEAFTQSMQESDQKLKEEEDLWKAATDIQIAENQKAVQEQTLNRKAKLAWQIAENERALQSAREREQKKIEDLFKKQKEQSDAFFNEAMTVFDLNDPNEALNKLKNIKKDHGLN